MDARQAAHDARHYPLLGPDKRDAIAHKWGDQIYFCPECDDACRDVGHYYVCPRHPREHDDHTAYMGTGTDHPESVRRLARLIADD